MKKGDKIGIVACSNGLKENSRQEMEHLKDTLEELGLIPVFSRYLYAGNGVESAGRRKRAEELMNFYRDEEIKGIFDVSGGDLANGVLPWLDYEEIKEIGKAFWGLQRPYHSGKCHYDEDRKPIGSLPDPESYLPGWRGAETTVSEFPGCGKE